MEMLKFLKGVVARSGAGVKDLPYNIGEPFSSTWGSWTHHRGTSKSLSQARGSGRRGATPENKPLPNLESQNMRRPSSSSVAGGIPPLGRAFPASQTSDRRAGSSTSGYRKDDYNWRYDNEEDLFDELSRASSALQNLQLDRKARNLTSSWRKQKTWDV